MKKADNAKYSKMRASLKGSIDLHAPKIQFPEIVEKEKGIFYIRGCFETIFEELEILGEGCAGVVKRVKKLATGEYFASKKVKIKDEEAIVSAIREFKSMSCLNHENIVRIYEIYIDESRNTIYTIMEYVNAGEMFEVIKKTGSFSEHIAQVIFKQILLAIRYMHEQKVCHRDLKPSNILTTEDGKCVKIADFNVSKFGNSGNLERDLKHNASRLDEEKQSCQKNILSSQLSHQTFQDGSNTIVEKNNVKRRSEQLNQRSIHSIQQLKNEKQICIKSRFNKVLDSPSSSDSDQSRTSSSGSPPNKRNDAQNKVEEVKEQMSLYKETKISQSAPNPTLIRLKERKLSNRWKRVRMWTNTGTVSYCAPEIFGDQEYDESVDVWSAGVVLYTMLSGEEPFVSEYLNDLINLIKKAEYSLEGPRWQKISDEAKDLIKKCLILNPQERIKPEQALLHPWITNKQNTSPLALMIFDNFENEALRFSKQLTTYQKLGLIRKVQRTKTIDLSILPNGNLEEEEEEEEKQDDQISTEKNSNIENLEDLQDQQFLLEKCQDSYENFSDQKLNQRIVINSCGSRENNDSGSECKPRRVGKTSILQQNSFEEKRNPSPQCDAVNKPSQTKRGSFQRVSSILGSISPTIKNLCNVNDDEDESRLSTPSMRTSPKKHHKTLIIHDRYRLNEQDKLIIQQSEINSSSPSSQLYSLLHKDKREDIHNCHATQSLFVLHQCTDNGNADAITNEIEYEQINSNCIKNIEEKNES